MEACERLAYTPKSLALIVVFLGGKRRVANRAILVSTFSEFWSGV